jgi:hypothetical protein
MQLRRISSTNLMRFTLASFGPMTDTINVVQMTGFSFLTVEEYTQAWKGMVGHEQMSRTGVPQ